MFKVSLLDMQALSFFRYKFFLCIITISILFLTFLSIPYIASGNKVMYIIFTIVSFIMLILGMLQDKSISVLIFTILIFVGFWLKHTLHLIFKYEYLEPIGNFHFSTNQINEFYLISSLGILGIVLAIFLIIFFSKYKYNKLPTVNIGNKTNIFIFVSTIAIFVLSLILNNTFMFLKLGAISIDSQLPWIVKVFSLWSMGAYFIAIVLIYTLLNLINLKEGEKD